MPIVKIDALKGRKAVEDNLGIKGFKSAPENLDSTSVKYVYETSQFSNLENCSMFSGFTSVAGDANKTKVLIGPKGYPNVEVETENQNMKLNLILSLSYTPAGIAADTGLIMRTLLRFYRSPLNANFAGGYATMQGNHWRQHLYQIRDLIIPFDHALAVYIERDSLDGNWPANTNLHWEGNYELKERGLLI